jgi:hypothetical protein
MNYDFLKIENAPQILVQAKKLIGTKEIFGPKHNDEIMSWAKDLGIEKIYTNDEIAWCGLFMAIVCKRAKLEINMTAREALWALNWNKFGTRQKVAMLGVGEDDVCYHILGGNQSNMVNITRIAKNRLSQIRRTSWKIAQPANVRVIKLNPNGFISENEA